MKRVLGIAVLVILSGAALLWLVFRQLTKGTPLPPQPRTIEQVLAAIGPEAERELKPLFQRAGVAFPPEAMTLVALKAERRLQLYGEDGKGAPKLVAEWPILAASGTSGLKLQEGDRQVPEGFYRIESLNPNSRFHLSLRVNYPNAEDLARAEKEGRDRGNLGSDIMIHGGFLSVGCLAMGDAVAEKLFYLAAKGDLLRCRLVIVPRDFRKDGRGDLPGEPAELYGRLRAELKVLPE